MKIEQQDYLETEQTMPQFNLVVAQNPIHSFFDVKPLDKMEATRIEKLLVENYEPSFLQEEEVIQHAETLKNLTSEIKGIHKQAALLIGERVSKANEILKNYKEGTFVKWVEAVFDSVKTAYNMMSYYELHQSLPLQSRDNFKKISPTAAYVIASRKNMPLENKIAFVNDYYSLKSQDMMTLIKEMFPSGKQTNPTSLNIRLINEIQKAVRALQDRKDEITNDDKKMIESVIVSLRSLVK